MVVGKGSQGLGGRKFVRVVRGEDSQNSVTLSQTRYEYSGLNKAGDLVNPPTITELQRVLNVRSWGVATGQSLPPDLSPPNLPILSTPILYSSIIII